MRGARVGGWVDVVWQGRGLVSSRTLALMQAREQKSKASGGRGAWGAEGLLVSSSTKQISRDETRPDSSFLLAPGNSRFA